LEPDKLIDRIRHDIQQRLEQLVAEADKLRRALVALDPRERMSPTPKATKTQPTAKQAVKTQPALKRTPARAVSASNGATPSRRTRPGETKVKVLAALSPDQGLTAGEVAQATGLARPTVSTTLSRLSKTGDVIKADRGYHLSSKTAKP
jgi:sugar-specific transcriptional regulator TrmB